MIERNRCSKLKLLIITVKRLSWKHSSHERNVLDDCFKAIPFTNISRMRRIRALGCLRIDRVFSRIFDWTVLFLPEKSSKEIDLCSHRNSCVSMVNHVIITDEKQNYNRWVFEFFASYSETKLAILTMRSINYFNRFIWAVIGEKSSLQFSW